MTRTRKPHSKVKPPLRPSKASRAGFRSFFSDCLCSGKELARLCRSQPRPSPAGRRPKLSLPQLLLALVFHTTMTANSFAQNLYLILGRVLSDAALSERRATLSWDILSALLARALRPLATRKRHPQAFYRRWRLTALDATQFSLLNTQSLLQAFVKKKTRKGRAAFPKFSVSVLLEIGLHQPLAAAIGRKGESEWPLSVRLLSVLPRGCLLLGDRLYGCAAFAAQALDQCLSRGCDFLFRARLGLKAVQVRRLTDGSRIVRLAVRHTKSRKILRYIELREILVVVSRPGFKSHRVRLWTSILDPAKAPAQELVRLYAQRWEQELYFRQMKLELHRSNLLHCQTPETVAQEVAALILATSLLAHQRAHVADPDHPALRVSFLKTLELLRPLWIVIALAGDILTEDQKRLLHARVQRFLRSQLTPPRRSRSCQRKVRQPVTKWPRLLDLSYEEGGLRFKVLRNYP